ncbi:MAG: hypothetical protein ABIG39_04015 [Candidatus Micrarchaeota archaeon]
MVWNTTAADMAQSLGNPSFSWAAFALMAVLMHFLILSILYMISKAFSIHDLYKWTRSELAQAVASAVLIGLLFSVVAGESFGIAFLQNQTELMAGSILMPGAAGATSIEVRADPFIASYAFLRNMLECVKTKYMDEFRHNRLREMALSIIITIQIFGIKIPIELSMILIPIYQKMVLSHYMANNYTWLAIALYFQIHFLKWVETAMFTVYLPLGIILRIFPWTRGAGGLLIALAIGLYLVYPLMFIIIIASSGSAPEGCQAVPITVQRNLCTTDPSSFVDLIEAAKAESSLRTGSLGGPASSMIIFGFFYPFTILVVVFAFVRSLAPFLGADIAEMGRGLFRMI